MHDRRVVSLAVCVVTGLLPVAAPAQDALRCAVVAVCAGADCDLDIPFTTVFLSGADGKLVVETDLIGDPLEYEPVPPLSLENQIYVSRDDREVSALLFNGRSGDLLMSALARAPEGVQPMTVTARCEGF